ncbi:MAG: DUF5320 domain-containing protein [Candidatus Latescibacterota bacterium]|nr:MAG: DUF5320 domain-containing protein [Candidatus Latescibacterota bacterium]
MPGGDRTGPQARGPMTGRGLGYCAGGDAPGAMYRGGGWWGGWGFGRGFGGGFARGHGRSLGRGLGRGFGPGFGGGLGRGFGWGRTLPGEEPYPIREDIGQTEIAHLKNEIGSLRSRLNGLLKRLEVAEKKQQEKKADE